MRSPCRTCANLEMDKNTAECFSCAARLEYLASIDPAAECRSDPAYSMAYQVSSKMKLMRASDQISEWDLIPR